jgi:energy-coupling factor transporter ATP-binding protein EcfA2
MEKARLCGVESFGFRHHLDGHRFLYHGITMTVPPIDTVHATNNQAFCHDLFARLRSGSHLILYGPRGAGKSTLLNDLLDQYRGTGTPCGVAPRTSGLPDVVAALAGAYPGVDSSTLGKRVARVRLRLAADHVPGVLLLDHATRMTTAMLGYLRRLRGGIAGALLVADVDSPRERERVRDWHAGALAVRMPLMPSRTLHQVALAAIQTCDLPKIEARALLQIIRFARGRIGWVKECTRRLQMPEYWRDGRLHLAVLCTDTEIAIRNSRSGPCNLRRCGEP